MIGFNTAGTTSVTLYQGGVSKTSATLPAFACAAVPTSGEVFLISGIPPTVGSEYFISIPNFRVSIAVSTTFYLVAQMTFTVSTATAYGSMEARRVR